jgi:phosphate transport system permease protein
MTTFASSQSPEAQPAVASRAAADPVDRPRTVSDKNSDYWLTLAGSLVGSLGLVWLLYERILPFSGTIGFIICWYVGFLAMFAAVTAVANSPQMVVDRVWSAVVTGGAAIVGLALVSAVAYTVIKGWTAVHHLNFLFQSESQSSPADSSLTQGGISNAIVGSLIELGIATAVSLPLGITTAVYMVEVGGRFSRVVRTVVEAMTALPDILAGLFIYATLILVLGVQKSGFAAGMALSVMMLPIIARSAYVQLQVVPGGLREASYALGAPQWRTVWRVVLPTQRAGLATAVILGMARAVGETAPVLITSGESGFFNVNPFNNEMQSLPLYIYQMYVSDTPKALERGFGAGIVLLALVLILFTTARLLSRSKVARR